MNWTARDERIRRLNNLNHRTERTMPQNKRMTVVRGGRTYRRPSGRALDHLIGWGVVLLLVLLAGLAH